MDFFPYVFFAVPLPSGATGRLRSNNPNEKENHCCVPIHWSPLRCWFEGPSFGPHVGKRGCSRFQRPEDSGAVIFNREAPVKPAVAPGRSGLDDVTDNLSTCRPPRNIFEPVVLLRVRREVH